MAVKRILTNEVYLGHLIQGKTEKINYKVKKNIIKPEQEWVKVENTHEAVVSKDDFMIVQHLLKTDSRKSPKTGKNNPFTGLLFCGDCGKQMVRRVIHYKGEEKVYYICSTKNRGEGCSRHSISENTLKEMAAESIRQFANSFLEEKRLFDKAVGCEANFETIACYDREMKRLKQEQDKYYSLCSGLYEDLRNGVVTKEEFERLHSGFIQKGKKLDTAMLKQEQLMKKILKKGVLSAGRLKTFQDCVELKEIDRHTLSSLVKHIYVFEEKRIIIDFYFMDTFEVMTELNRRIHMNGAGRVQPAERRVRYGESIKEGVCGCTC